MYIFHCSTKAHILSQSAGNPLFLPLTPLLYLSFRLLQDIRSPTENVLPHLPQDSDRLKEQYGLKSQLLHAYRLEMPACTGELSNLSERKFVAPLPKLFQNILKAEKYSEE